MYATGGTKVVGLVQKLLRAGPLPQEKLLGELKQSGCRIDVGGLWELCRTHGLADLRDGVWTPRGWASPKGGQPISVASGSRLPTVPDGWADAARGAAQALREE